MTKRLPGSERTREALNGLIDGRLRVENARSDLVRLATRLIIEEGLEAEVRDALGRDYYEHGGDPGRGHRNGVREARMKTAEGFIGYVRQLTHAIGRIEALPALMRKPRALRHANRAFTPCCASPARPPCEADDHS